MSRKRKTYPLKEYSLLTTEESELSSTNNDSPKRNPTFEKSTELIENCSEDEEVNEVNVVKKRKKSYKHETSRKKNISSEIMCPPTSIPSKKPRNVTKRKVQDEEQQLLDAKGIDSSEEIEREENFVYSKEEEKKENSSKNNDGKICEPLKYRNTEKKFSLELLRKVTRNNPLLFEIASRCADEMIAAAFKYIGNRNNLELVEWCEAVLLYLCLAEKIDLTSLTWDQLCSKVEACHFNINTYICTSRYRNSSETLLSYFEINRLFKEQNFPQIGEKAFLTLPPVNYDALNKIQFPVNNTSVADFFDQLPCVNK